MANNSVHFLDSVLTTSMSIRFCILLPTLTLYIFKKNKRKNLLETIRYKIHYIMCICSCSCVMYLICSFTFVFFRLCVHSEKTLYIYIGKTYIIKKIVLSKVVARTFLCNISSAQKMLNIEYNLHKSIVLPHCRYIKCIGRIYGKTVDVELIEKFSTTFVF